VKNILVLNGPNLNLLGEREPETYGTMTLSQLNARLAAYARKKGAALRARQSNHEGELIDLLHAHRKWAAGIVFNPGAYSHYSYALRDAVASISVPTIEVHLSNIKKREKFRRTSVIEPACVAQLYGKGAASYFTAIDILLKIKKT
jgi:3-dehydroquinate dehydratase-2